MSSESPFVQARSVRPDETEAMLQVLCAAFRIDPGAAKSLFYQDPFFDLSHKRVLVSPTDGLVSCLTVIPASLRIGEALIPIGGIAGVATHPSSQRQGHAGLLLSATIGALTEELSYPIAGLFPYSYGFYRKFGWETVSRAAVWTGPASCLPRNSEAASVRPSHQELGQDRAATHRLHEAATHGQTGAFHRDARRWKVIETLTPTRQTVVYESHSGIVDGYLFFERWETENEVRIVIHEMHGTTERARRGLVGFLAGQSDAQAVVEWEASPDDLALFGFFSLNAWEQDRPQITLSPGMMLRLVDLPSALAHLHTAQFAPVLQSSGGTLTIRASDPQRPQNEQPLRLHKTGIHNGSLSDRDWLAAPITVLAQLYCGYRTPSEAASVGDLSVSSPETLSLADRLFPPRRPFVAPADQF